MTSPPAIFNESVESFDDEEVDDYLDDGSYDVAGLGINHGQYAAGDVYGGMHQTIYNEIKLLSRLISAHQLTPGYVAQVMATFVARDYHRPGRGAPLSRADAARLLADEHCVVLVDPADPD